MERMASTNGDGPLNIVGPDDLRTGWEPGVTERLDALRQDYAQRMQAREAARNRYTEALEPYNAQHMQLDAALNSSGVFDTLPGGRLFVPEGSLLPDRVVQEERWKREAWAEVEALGCDADQPDAEELAELERHKARRREWALRWYAVVDFMASPVLIGAFILFVYLVMSGAVRLFR